MSISRGGDICLPLMNLLRLNSTPIFQQLNLEQKLLRTSSQNWCIVNNGTNPPNIVMGTSGNPSELIEIQSVLRNHVPVIKRFSGGGTVIVDQGTMFITFICNKDAIPGLQPYPHPIMSWTGQLYGEVLKGIGDFHLRENDYVFGDYKFGGNAQSITKNRWVHHTSFLWDYDVKNMAYLKLPSRAPKYRLARNHGEFLCPLKNYLPTRSTFIDKTITSLGTYFSVRPIALEMINGLSNTKVPNSTLLLTKQELEEALVTQFEDHKLKLHESLQ